MAFIPNIDALRGNFSSFAARGSAPSVQFLQRFGSGFQGTPFVAQQFRGEPDEGFRRAIPDSRRFANAFEDRGEEQFVAPPPTYTPPPPPEPTVSTVPESFYSNLTASQSYVQRTESDASIQNAAAALDPTRIQSILDAARNASGFTGLNGISPMMFQTRDDVVPISEPELGRNIFNYEDIGNAFTPSNDQVNEVVEPLPEPVPYDPPPVYIAPPAPPYQPEPTYSRVDEEEDDDEIESIDVVGRRRDDMDDEEIESIDVRGRARDREDLESVDVRGRTRGDERDYVNEARQQQQPVYGGDNPWETFKQLYTDFMTGGKGGAVLQEFNRKEAQGELGYDYSPVLDPDSFVQAYESGVGRDTDAIMRAKLEREEYDTRAGDVFRKDQSAMAGATIINNNQTIATTRSQEMSRTNRVFGDDNTFNRLAAADSNNPRFG